jgi:hypothetical protein
MFFLLPGLHFLADQSYVVSVWPGLHSFLLARPSALHDHILARPSRLLLSRPSLFLARPVWSLVVQAFNVHWWQGLHCFLLTKISWFLAGQAIISLLTRSSGFLTGQASVLWIQDVYPGSRFFPIRDPGSNKKEEKKK